MKATLLGGALALALWGAPALAGGDAQKGDQVGQRDCPPELIGTADCPEYLGEDEALGGAGEEGTLQEDPAGEESLRGMEDDALQQDEQFTDDDFVGGAGEEGAPSLEPRSDVFIEDDTSITTVTPREERRERADMRGVTVLLGGGVEGYTGQLAPEINPGPAWGVGAAFKPSRIFGLELGYSGAVNNVPGAGVGTDLNDGTADIVRNGGSAVATLGLTSSPVQPYLLGGIGIDHYNVRESTEGSSQFRDNTIGSVPLGVGLRTHVGSFTADLRGNYGLLFEQQFAPEVGGTDLGDIGDRTPTGRYSATLNLGATF